MSSVRIRLGTLPKVLEILEFQGLFFFIIGNVFYLCGIKQSITYFLLTIKVQELDWNDMVTSIL